MPHVMHDIGQAEVVEALAPEKRRSPWLRAGKWILLGVVLLFVARSLIKNFRQVPWEQVRIVWGFVALGMLALLGARLSNALNCRALLAALGADLPARQVAGAIWVASLGRYVPGKMAAVAGAVLMLVRLGARPPVAVAALLLSTGLMMLMGVILSAPLLLTPKLRQVVPAGPYLAGAIIAVGLVCLYPPVFLRMANWGMKRFKKQALTDRVRLNHYAAALGLTVCRNTFLAVGLFFAAKSIEPVHWSSFWLMLAAGGLASWVGFLAVFAPAGLGVHEAIYIATLTPLLGPKVAILVVMFRLFHVIADALVGGAGMAMMRKA